MMVTATIECGVLKLKLLPFHKVLALKGSLEIPLDVSIALRWCPKLPAWDRTERAIWGQAFRM
jgi:hypothetical protein